MMAAPVKALAPSDARCGDWKATLHVPTIAIIDGVAIILWTNDHPPPHIHAKGGGFSAKISIETGMVLDGHLPKTKLKRIREWLDANRDQVAYAWDEVRAGRSFEGKIG